MRYRFRCQLSSLPPPTYQRFILWRGNNISHRHKNSTIHQTVIYSAVFVPISLIFPPFHPLPFSLSLSFSFLVAPLASLLPPPLFRIFSPSLLNDRVHSLFREMVHDVYIYMYLIYMWKIDLDASFDRSASFDHRDFWWFCSVILHKNREHLMRYVWGGN